jgi:pimeloyl-ACP methyl ester carboxylesterase
MSFRPQPAIPFVFGKNEPHLPTHCRILISATMGRIFATIFRTTVRSLVLALLASTVFLLSCQSKLIYYPRPYDKAALHDIMQRQGRRIEALTSQGRQVAFYLPPAQNPGQPPAYLWLVCGGNGSLALDYSGEPLRWDPRFGYLFIDYPGYGLCEGQPSPAHVEENIVALSEALRKDLHWSEEEFRQRTGVLGHSLGSAAALIAADHLHLQSAILCAPFTTMTDMAKRVVGWPLCYLNQHRYDNLARLGSICARGAQVRIFHGCEDNAIPVAMSRKLAAAHPGHVRLTEVPNCGHNEVVTDAVPAIGKAMLELSNLPPR